MVRVLFEVLLPVALVAIVGMLLRRQMPLDQVTLNRVVIYGMSPALIFTSLVRADLSGSGAVGMVTLAVGTVVVMGALTLAVALPFGVRGRDLSGLLLVTLFMNSGNYGLPASRFAFGEAGFTLAIFYFIVQSVLSQTLGVAVAAAGSAQAGPGLLREVTTRVLRMPQIYATVAAFAVRATGFDPVLAQGLFAGLFRGLALLGDATLPMMLVVLGTQLAGGLHIQEPGLVTIATILRLLVSPLAAYGLGLALGLAPLNLAVGVMLAGMPAAVNTTILALEFDSRPSLVVSTVIVSSVLSVLTLSVLLTLIGV
ncbi:AEC family transporter [Candidatus Chloroploca sp. Khr17]|uniref:AEC family transporter n=1 Tax=Candidatus Chloroploca sp. Khr17 TaxID=2496869 RepID=UPI00101CE05D|nr:AEC family transporter [Candidatus Chloroploca sp. Khr17]